MQKFNGFKAEVTTTGATPLPVGTYVCRIMGAKVEQTSWGTEQLKIQFDIDEGEFKDYFTNKYNDSQFENKKYGGVFRLNVPLGNGSDTDKWAVTKFNNCIGCIEESNPGYSWNWDETTLKGKKVGITFRNEEWAVEGRSGWSARPFNMATVEATREGKVKLPKDKPLPDEKKAKAGINIEPDGYQTIEDNSGDLPF